MSVPELREHLTECLHVVRVPTRTASDMVIISRIIPSSMLANYTSNVRITQCVFIGASQLLQETSRRACDHAQLASRTQMWES